MSKMRVIKREFYSAAGIFILLGLIAFSMLVSAGEYSIGMYVRDQSNITLGEGWNFIGMTMEENDTGTQRNISLEKGWNTIGYSSAAELLQSDVKFNNGSDEYSWSAAVSLGKVQSRFSFFDSAIGNKKYKYTGIADLYLRLHRGYWIYANEPGTLIINSVGGTLANQTYQITDLMFANDTATLNITNAEAAGWINRSIYYWNSTSSNFESMSEGALYPWRGYFIKALKDGITLLRQN